MTNEEVMDLVQEYFVAEGYQFPGDFEHRVDPDSSAVLYSFIRRNKPKSVLSIGTWLGGSACIIMSALLENQKEDGKSFTYVASELLDDKREDTRKNVKRKCGRVPKLIGDITKNLDKVPKEIDFLFHDTNHDTDTTQWVVDNIFPRIKEGSCVVFHDWAVYEDENGNWLGKGEGGVGGWPETEFLLEMHRKGTLPLEKVYWNFKNPGAWELGVFTYRSV